MDFPEGQAPHVIKRLSTSKPRVGIIGARGYTGNELMKLLIAHPNMDLAAVSSRQLAGKRISSNLKGMYAGSDAGSGLDLRYVNLEPPEIVEFTKNNHIDAWVMALPNGVCAPFVKVRVCARMYEFVINSRSLCSSLFF